jgi:hypothetical protein
MTHELEDEYYGLKVEFFIREDTGEIMIDP